VTLGEKLDRAAQDDPRFARSVRRLRLASWIFGIGVALAIGIGIWAVAVNFGQDTTIERQTTTIKRLSVCERNAVGERCQVIRRRAEEGESVRDLCRRFWRVGYACPRPGSGVRLRSAEARSAASAEDPGRRAPSGTVFAPGLSDDGGGETGGDSAPGDPGSEHAPAPDPDGAPAPPSTSPTTPASSPTAATPPPAPTPPPASEPVTPPAPPPAQPIRDTVTGALEDAGDVVSGVTGAPCALALALCPR
jgi:hypothetical protein